MYRAEDIRLGRPVALKFVSEDLASDPEAIRRLRSEARAASALNHGNICTIYDIGEDGGQPFIVMELMTGRTLRDQLAQGPLKVHRLVDIGIEIADALHAAHSQGYQSAADVRADLKRVRRDIESGHSPRVDVPAAARSSGGTRVTHPAAALDPIVDVGGERPSASVAARRGWLAGAVLAAVAFVGAGSYALVEPMMREIARLEFDGSLQAVGEERDEHTQTMDFGAWKVVVSYGAPTFGSIGPPGPPGNPEPVGRALVGQLAPDQFLVAGYFCRIDFQAGGASAGRSREFVRVEEGEYRNGVFERLRIWNGDQTDGGLNFSSAPQILRVQLGTY